MPKRTKENKKPIKRKKTSKPKDNTDYKAISDAVGEITIGISMKLINDVTVSEKIPMDKKTDVLTFILASIMSSQLTSVKLVKGEKEALRHWKKTLELVHERLGIDH